MSDLITKINIGVYIIILRTQIYALFVVRSLHSIHYGSYNILSRQG